MFNIDNHSKQIKLELEMTCCAKPTQTTYTSLEEATKFIPRFDGYNIKPSIFINECEKAWNLVSPQDMENLKHLILSKLVGEPALLFSDICLCVHDILRKIHFYYVNQEIFNNLFYIDRDQTQELEDTESQPCDTKNTHNQIIPKHLVYFCQYCKLSGHTVENHCCKLLKTNHMFKMLERNRLSRHLFLNRLYMREIGVTRAPILATTQS